MAVYVTGTFRINEGKEEKIIALLTEWFKKIEEEEGTLIYSIFRSNKDPRQYLVFEKYRDQEANAFHNSPTQRGAFDAAARESEILEPASFDMYEPVISISEKAG